MQIQPLNKQISQKKELINTQILKLSSKIYKDTIYTKPHLKGFTNHQNCCYINCCLQIIINCNIFPPNYIPQNSPTQYLHNLSKIYLDLQNQQKSIDIKQFRDIINKSNNNHIHYQHNVTYDAMEFLLNIINSLDSSIRQKFISIDQFNYEMESIVIPIIQLQGNLNVREYLKGIKLCVYPQFMIVEISRAKQDGYKSHNPIHYSESISLNQVIYKLKATLNHRGFQKDGHYNVKIRTQQGYYLADQNTIVENALETRSRNVVAIIYEKIH